MKRALFALAGAVLLCGAVSGAWGDTCACPSVERTLNYWLFADGSKPVRDNDCTTFDDCFLGYFIPGKDKTYTVLGADGQEVQMTFGWPDTHAWNGDYLHTAPQEDEARDQWTWGLDIFGWVDKCCRIHLFAAEDKVHAWHAGLADVVTTDEVRVADPRPLPDEQGNMPPYYHTTYMHVTPKQGLTPFTNVTAGEHIGGLAGGDGPHLHISFYDNAAGKTANPIEAGLITMYSHQCVVPEPATVTLILLGMGMLAARRRR